MTEKYTELKENMFSELRKEGFTVEEITGYT